MKKKEIQLEELLHEKYPSESEQVIQDVVVDFLPPEEVEDSYFRADGNAQLKDFIRMVGEICMSAMDKYNIQFLPYEKAYLVRKDPDQKLYKNMIIYRIIKREHAKDSGYKPRPMGDVLIDSKSGKSITTYTERFETIIQFSFMSTNYDVAWDMMDMFEDIMVSYAGYIKGNGIADYQFLNQEGDLIDNDFREVLIVFTLNYKVKTEKNRVISNENIKEAHVHGKAVMYKNKDNKN